MRKLSLLAAIAVVITLGSCSNDKELDNKQATSGIDKEVGFRSFIDKGAASRATVTNSSNILGFTVTGWWDRTNRFKDKKTAGAPSITDAQAFAQAIAEATADEYMFNAMDITRRESGIGNWNYSPMRYWPSDEVIGGGVTFFAYSPASSKNVTKETAPSSGIYTGGLKDYKGAAIIYTVPDPSRTEAQEDFMLARTKSMKESDGNNGDVVLNFAHALSRVRFFARTTNTDLTYVIGGVEMMGLAKTGEISMADIPLNALFSYNDTNPTGPAPLVLWTPDAASKGNIGIDMGESPINLLDQNKYHSLQGETNALMVLPQTTAKGVIDDTDPSKNSGFLIKVSYKAYFNNPDGSYLVGSKDKYEDVYFKVLDGLRSKTGDEVSFSFEIGRQYNFCLEFGKEAGEPIKFHPEISEGWNDAVPTITLP